MPNEPMNNEKLRHIPSVDRLLGEKGVQALAMAYANAYDYLVIQEINMSTHNATEARAKLYNLIDEVAESHQPIVITGKRNNAV